MRASVAILLLVAAAFHPLAHAAEDAVVCPCIGAATVELLPPLDERLDAIARLAESAAPPLFVAETASETAPRAPPAR